MKMKFLVLLFILIAVSMVNAQDTGRIDYIRGSHGGQQQSAHGGSATTHGVTYSGNGPTHIGAYHGNVINHNVTQGGNAVSHSAIYSGNAASHGVTYSGNGPSHINSYYGNASSHGVTYSGNAVSHIGTYGMTVTIHGSDRVVHGGGFTRSNRMDFEGHHRTVVAIRDWHGPGEYGGRFFHERPRYSYDGRWYYYGTGPLPFYVNYDNVYPVYDLTYAEAPYLANWIPVARWHGPGEYGGRFFHQRPRYFYDGAWYYYGYGPLPYYVNYDNANPVYDAAYTKPPIDSAEANLNLRVQSVLAEKNYYRGEVDGFLGPVSHEAIRAFQADNNLAATGEIDDPTLDSLGL